MGDKSETNQNRLEDKMGDKCETSESEKTGRQMDENGGRQVKNKWNISGKQLVKSKTKTRTKNGRQVGHKWKTVGRQMGNKKKQTGKQVGQIKINKETKWKKHGN